MSVTGYQELCVDLDRIKTKIENADFLEQAGEYVKEQAKKNVARDFTGALRESILMEMVEQDGNRCAVVYSDNDHALFVEVGTGQKGAANHAGISPNISPVYANHPWYVHESMLDPMAIAKYHWKKVVSKDGQVFYRMEGQAAQPFLYPALRQNIDTVIEICNKGIDEALK